MLPSFGGQGVGTATGRIVLDTSQLQQAAQMARQVGRQIDQALAGIDSGSRRAESSLQRLSRGVGKLRSELFAIGAGGAVLTGLGLRTAGAFQEAEVKLAGMVGGLEQSKRLVEDLRKQAKAAGLPFQDMLAVATRLLPTLEGNVDELQRWYDLVKRTAVLNQQEGVSGAAFSINEALTSNGRDLVSLVERFNVSRAALREELANNGNDFFAALDTVLNKMGITTETAENMGKTFNASLRVARDAAGQVVAEGFTPLLESLTPILQRTAEWLQRLRESNPEILRFGAGLATVATVGAPALLLLERMVTTMRTLKQLGILSALGKGGVVAGAGAAGVFGGIQISRGLGQLTGNRIGDANASLQGVIDLLQKTLFIAATYVVRTAQTVVDVWARTVNSFGNGVDMMLGAMARFVRAVAAFLPSGLGGGALSRSADRLQGAAGGGGGAAALALSQQFRQSTDGFLRNWANLIQGSAASAATGGGGSTLPAANGRGSFTGDQTAAIREWAAGVQRIEQDAAQQRLDATRQYEQQRTAAIAQYELSLARDAEDFARNRLRQQQQLENQIADILADGAERDAEWIAENNERIAETRADGLERIAKLESDYARDRERAANDHRDRLLSAAARLDAVAVREEQRRYATQQSDAETAFNERVASERQSIEERIEQEREGHQERLQEARQADQERIADMREAQAEQQRLEDEDRAIRLQRQADDHQRQLDEQARANAERMAQITAQAARERAALDEDFLQQLASLDLYNQHWLNLQKVKEAQSLASFERWWDRVNEQFNATVQGPVTEAEAWPTHFVTPRSSALGAGPSASPLAGTTNRNVTITEGAITVNAAPGQNEAQVARLVRDEMISLLEGVQ